MSCSACVRLHLRVFVIRQDRSFSRSRTSARGEQPDEEKVDSFLSLQGSDSSRRHIRSQIDNSLSVSVNRFLGISLKHHWFYLYSRDYREEYRNSQIITSADMKTDFKLW